MSLGDAGTAKAQCGGIADRVDSEVPLASSRWVRPAGESAPTNRGRPVRLSNTEFELLLCLMRNPGRIMSRKRILRAVWGYTHDPGTNILDVYIGYLRRKLRTDERQAPIKTVRSLGYRLDSYG